MLPTQQHKVCRRCHTQFSINCCSSLFGFLWYLNFLVDGKDFAASGSLTFNFQMGAEGNKSCIDIDIMNDMNFEGDHSFEVTLGPNMPTLRGGTGGFGSSTSTTIIIQDYKGMFVIDRYDVLCNFLIFLTTDIMSIPYS